MMQKSRLTSSSEKGMYWLASASTCSSSSSSRSPPGSTIFLVITADCGIAMATCLVRVPLLATTRRTASATSSNFSIWPSVIQPFSKGSLAKRSTTYSPVAVWPSSTSLALDELISSPISDACLRPNRMSRKLTRFPNAEQPSKTDC
jgi:hypothetical protein